ncbi:hypothetical protein M0R45_028088 [Rubus argutus]|uniref:F-box protein At3g26010-like beta-propeller domain-containing protein n=1 Tax=Rubus argutus TaxID=59490 RepID=A0AAW1W4U6_RUBAR
MLKRGRFSLNFLPRYQSAAKEKVIAWRPVVVGAYNDLVLCCATTYSQRDYFICNPYTKQWVALPPVPDCRAVVTVGFICEPYYYCNRREENNSTSTSNIQLNVNYKYAIVLLLKPHLLGPRTCPKLEVQIFSSETGKWTESVVLSPRSFCFDDLARNPVLAYKGMLYWWTECDGYMIGLDPFSNNNRQFHVIDFPVGEPGSVSVSRGGRLRVYEVSNGWVETRWFRDEHVVSVWELKDDDDDKVDGRRVGKWCLLSTVPLARMVLENPFSSPSFKKKAVGLAFDPNNDDILYLAFYDDRKEGVYRSIVTCNISAKTFKQATTRRIISDSPFKIPLIGVISFTVPWLPTPVPRLEYNHKDMHAAHFSTCGWCYGRRARGVRFE